MCWPYEYRKKYEYFHKNYKLECNSTLLVFESLITIRQNLTIITKVAVRLIVLKVTKIAHSIILEVSIVLVS